MKDAGVRALISGQDAWSQGRAFTGLLTGHNTLGRYLRVKGLTDCMGFRILHVPALPL